MSKYTQKDDLCYDFLNIIYSNQISELLVHLGGTLPTKAVFNNINLISLYPWLKHIPLILKGNTRKHFDSKGKLLPTIEYEKTIGRQIKQLLSDQQLIKNLK